MNKKIITGIVAGFMVVIPIAILAIHHFVKSEIDEDCYEE